MCPLFHGHSPLTVVQKGHYQVSSDHDQLYGIVDFPKLGRSWILGCFLPNQTMTVSICLRTRNGLWRSNAYLPIISCSFYYSSCKSPNLSWIILEDKSKLKSPLMSLIIQQIAQLVIVIIKILNEDLGIIIPLESVKKSRGIDPMESDP